ncbi:MAG: hypothetical protein LBH25_03710 [Fibromonadaceae bacterium]|jgi:hypothetical protein|nr:hypothetical protein [Fibromonadaceae bacterium]
MAEKEMKNPWENLKTVKGKYTIASDDYPDIINLDNNLKGKFKLNLNLLPEPFIGNPNAPIYLLNLNPGFDKENAKEHKENKKLRDCITKNNLHKPMEYPFYWLNPDLKGTGGAKYWKEGNKVKTKKRTKTGKPIWQTISPRLGELLEDKALKETLIARKIFCVEYFPYHSESYSISKKVPSQGYSRNLIENAIKDNSKLFIIMRKKTEIFKLFPKLKELQKKGRVFVCSSSSNPCISRKNIGEAAFKKIIEKIIAK